MEKVFSFMRRRPLYLRGKVPSTHWIVGWVGGSGRGQFGKR